nr:hypothetical protein [uncultured Halomonas sp.]
MAKSTRRKALPPIDPKTDARQRPLLEAIKEILETSDGVRGDPLDRKLTVRDMVNAKLAKYRRGAPGSDGILTPGDVIGNQPTPNLSTPPPPESLNVSPSFGYVVLSWALPGDQYGNHALTNIYRSDEDNFANAVLVGRDPGQLYSDYVRDAAGTGVGYYYWITFVSDTGVEGPPNSPAGTYAEIIPDVTFLLQKIADDLADEPADLGSPDETFIINAKRFAIRSGPNDEPVYPLVTTTINGEPVVVMNTALIAQASIQEGQIGPISAGKLVDADGTPITTVGGLIKADALDVDNLKVAEAARFSGDVFSRNFVSGKSGWALLQSGYAELNEAMIRGNLEVQSITVNGQSPFVGIRRSVPDEEYITYRPEGYPSVSKAWDISTYVPKMPGGSKLEVTFYPKGSARSGGNLGSYGDQGTGRARATGRLRMWINGQLLYDQSFVEDTGWVDRVNSAISASVVFPRRSEGHFFRYTMPAYSSNVRIRMRMDVGAQWWDGSDAWREYAAYSLDGDNVITGNIFRLG